MLLHLLQNLCLSKHPSFHLFHHKSPQMNSFIHSLSRQTASHSSIFSLMLNKSALSRLHDKEHCQRICSMVWMLSPHLQEWSVLMPLLTMLSPILSTPALALLSAHQSCLRSNAPSAIFSMDGIFGGISYFRVLPLFYSILLCWYMGW